MQAVFQYLLQMSCWLAAFWLVYIAALRKETFFSLNRWFLNAGLAVALVLPLFPVRYKVYTDIETVLIRGNLSGYAESSSNTGNFNWYLTIYLSGVFFFILRQILQHYRLYRLRKNSSSSIIGSIKVYYVNQDTAPFSFINQVYISSAINNPVAVDTVIAHEKVHIDERHWADLLLLEMVRTLQWFNPLLVFYRKAMMQNHEYLADSGTLNQGVSARTYRAVLANQMLGLEVVSFANSFTILNTTQRIFMMKRNKSNPIKRLKLLLVLPLVALILTAFSKPAYVYNEAENTLQQEKGIDIEGKVLDENGAPLPGASIVIANSTYGTVSDVDGTFSLKGVNADAILVVSFVGYETQAKSVKKKMNFSMQRSVIGIEIRKETIAPPPPPPPPLSLKNIGENGEKPLIVVDGEIVNIDLNTIDPSSIQSINVLKNVSATNKYGEKARDGVVEIYIKKKPESTHNPDQEVFVIVEDMPQFPGGEEALNQYLLEKTANSVQHGQVYVSFVIDTKGKVNETKVIRSNNKVLSQKAIDIVNGMPEWKPGKQRNKPVKVSYTVKLDF
ncbi:carboxypeptidase-like regulatory domain-containing protein [Roseimarinus sediminis]|uniref:carboxypeptidase-like regulatory domain-containing protein n=1 Tax=Roseimarinus sediminis TaxID=1610899 RepID=UPI003D22FB19